MIKRTFAAACIGLAALAAHLHRRGRLAADHAPLRHEGHRRAVRDGPAEAVILSF